MSRSGQLHGECMISCYKQQDKTTVMPCKIIFILLYMHSIIISKILSHFILVVGGDSGKRIAISGLPGSVLLHCLLSAIFTISFVGWKIIFVNFYIFCLLFTINKKGQPNYNCFQYKTLQKIKYL